MKVLLIILAGIVALFAGGCVVILSGNAMYGSQASAIAILMFAVAAANVALIAGVARDRPWVMPLLWIFMVLDLVFGVILAVSLGNDRYVGPPAMIAAVFLVIKGVLSGVAAYRLKQTTDAGG